MRSFQMIPDSSSLRCLISGLNCTETVLGFIYVQETLPDVSWGFLTETSLPKLQSLNHWSHWKRTGARPQQVIWTDVSEDLCAGCFTKPSLSEFDAFRWRWIRNWWIGHGSVFRRFLFPRSMWLIFWLIVFIHETHALHLCLNVETWYSAFMFTALDLTITDVHDDTTVD